VNRVLCVVPSGAAIGLPLQKQHAISTIGHNRCLRAISNGNLVGLSNKKAGQFLLSDLNELAAFPTECRLRDRRDQLPYASGKGSDVRTATFEPRNVSSVRSKLFKCYDS
jgi:hypothetical protein